MAEDDAGDPIAHLIVAARAFERIVEEHVWQSDGFLGNLHERSIAAVAVVLAESLSAAEAIRLDPADAWLGEAVADLRRAFAAILGGIGWDWVLGPDPRGYACDCDGRFRDEVEIPWLATARAWLPAPGVPRSRATDEYREAVRLGIAPADMTPAEAAAAYPGARHRAKRSPIFGDRPPMLPGNDEVNAYAKALTALDAEARAAGRISDAINRDIITVNGDPEPGTARPAWTATVEPVPVSSRAHAAKRLGWSRSAADPGKTLDRLIADELVHLEEQGGGRMLLWFKPAARKK